MVMIIARVEAMTMRATGLPFRGMVRVPVREIPGTMPTHRAVLARFAQGLPSSMPANNHNG